MRESYRPGYFLLPPLPVRRSAPPPRADGWFGRLELEFVCRSPLHVGSGVPTLVRLGADPALVEGFAALPAPGQPRLVVPGSSVKGAVRAAVEALTPSCMRTVRQGVCTGTDELCPACALLGAPGLRATVAFSDLRPIGGAYRVAAKEIAQRYSHRKAPARGRRLYRKEPESPLPRDREVLVVLTEGSRLAGEVAVTGATEEGLGLLTIALCLPPLGLPYLRLGGGKNRGLGVVEVTLKGWGGGRGLRSAASTLPSGGAGSPRGLDPVRRWQERAIPAYPSLRSGPIASEASAGGCDGVRHG